MSKKAIRYHRQTQTSLDHTTGKATKTYVLGGHKRLAQTARGKDVDERLAELFKHQRPQELSAESERFLRRGADNG